MDRTDVAAGPIELVQMATVARHYYVENRSKVEIAATLGISRFKVARLIEAARERGIIRFEISCSGDIDVELSDALQTAYGLAHAIVVDTPEDDDAVLRPALGAAAADLLAELVTERDVLGLAWSRAVSAMADALTSMRPAVVVQLTGALPRDDLDESTTDLVRKVARIGGGRGHLFYAPLIVADADTARTLRAQPEVRDAFAMFPRLTIAVVGLGGWAAGTSTVFDALRPAERRAAARIGVRAELCGILLDDDGGLVESDISERMVTISPHQLRAVPEVIGIAYGRAKAPSVLAAVRGGLVNGLVVHSALARELLDRHDG